MEYTDIFLKFDDEQSAIAALPDFRIKDKDGADIWKTNGDGYALDVIGEIYDVTQGEDINNPVIKNLPGFHLNLRTWDGKSNPSPSSTITPNRPRRVWA
jgi:hypothetical protein